MRHSSFRFLELGIVTAMSWLALSACRHDASTNESDAALDGSSAKNYRAVLLSYEAKGWEAVTGSPTSEGWMVAMNRTDASDGSTAEIWTIKDGRITNREPIGDAADTAAKLPCPNGSSPRIASVAAFAVDRSGNGLLQAEVTCPGLDGSGGAFFERRAGAYRVIDWPNGVPGASTVQSQLACGGGGCAWLHNESGFPASELGASSIAVTLFHDGTWTPLMDDRETEDNEGFLVSGIAALDDAFIVTGQHSKENVATALAFKVTAAGASPFDVPGYAGFSAPSPAEDRVVFFARKSANDGAILTLDGGGSVTSLDARDATSGQGLTHVVLLGERVVEAQNVALSQGADNALRIDGSSLVFPVPTSQEHHAFVRDAIVRDHEALFVGTQFATKTSSPNVVAPLFVLVTDNPDLTSAEPLPAETLDESCNSPKDCADKLPWGIKCAAGYFSCADHVCGRVCEMGQCGNQVCDVEGGETKESCALDCR